MSEKILTGVQQIMLGTVIHNEKTAEETLSAIRSAGYDGIELNQFMIHPTSFLVRAMTRAAGMPVGRGGKLPWKELVQKSGLKVISLHTDLGSLKRDPEAVMKEAEGLGTRNLVITGMYRFDYGSIPALDGLCKDLDSGSKRLAESGFHLLYHNHNVEFCRLQNGQTAYEYLLNHSDVEIEFDSYWPSEAGVPVSAVMERVGSRMRLWHINDRGFRLQGPAMTPIIKSDSCELGTGNLDLTGFSKIAKQNGIEAVILESHKNWIEKNPIKSIQMSAEFLKNEFQK